MLRSLILFGVAAASTSKASLALYKIHTDTHCQPLVDLLLPRLFQGTMATSLVPDETFTVDNYSVYVKAASTELTNDHLGSTRTLRQQLSVTDLDGPAAFSVQLDATYYSSWPYEQRRASFPCEEAPYSLIDAQLACTTLQPVEDHTPPSTTGCSLV